MKHPFSVLFLLGAMSLSAPVLLPAAKASDQAQEYEQARKIALKDPHVQDAFRKAEERLDDRIVEIDPTLKPYVDKRAAQRERAAAPPSPTPEKKHVTTAKSSPAPAGGTTHVIAKGDTLSSIALQYKVSVASLKAANQITDDRKLRVGQKLVIPAPSAQRTASPTPAAEHTSTTTKKDPEKEEGFWDKLKNSLD
jgi:LysM repeat protein